jgi:hypothetical protein
VQYAYCPINNQPATLEQIAGFLIRAFILWQLRPGDDSYRFSESNEDEGRHVMLLNALAGSS